MIFPPVAYRCSFLSSHLFPGVLAYFFEVFLVTIGINEIAIACCELEDFKEVLEIYPKKLRFKYHHGYKIVFLDLVGLKFL